MKGMSAIVAVIGIAALVAGGLFVTGNLPFDITGNGQIVTGGACDSNDDCASQSCGTETGSILIQHYNGGQAQLYNMCCPSGIGYVRCEVERVFEAWMNKPPEIIRQIAPGSCGDGTSSGSNVVGYNFYGVARLCVGAYCGDGITQSPQEACDPESPTSKYASCTLNGEPGFKTCIGTIGCEAANANCCDYGACDTSGAECVPGATQACGNCGTDTCNQYGLWSGVCEGTGVCTPGVSKTVYSAQGCPHVVTCNAQCSWPTTPADACIPNSQTTTGCPANKFKVCGSACTYGSCQDIPGCAKGSTAACGNCGSKTCNVCVKDQFNCPSSYSCDACYNSYGSAHYFWGTCNEPANACQPGATKTVTNSQGWPHEVTCNSACQWNSPPSDQCSVGETISCTASDGRLGMKSCQNGVFSVCIGQGECVPNVIESCGNCGEKQCSPTGYWGSCGGTGVCSPNAKRNVVSSHGCSYEITCLQDCSWPVTPVDDCTSGQTRVCTIDGIPGSEPCASCQWAGCVPDGVCVPGSTQACGDCGMETCSASGSWGDCLQRTDWQSVCDVNFVCVQGNSWDCIPADPDLSIIINPDGYPVGHPVSIPVTVTIPGVNVAGFNVIGSVYKKDPILGLKTGAALASQTISTNTQGQGTFMFNMTAKGDFILEVVATKGSGTSQIRKEATTGFKVLTATSLDWENEPLYYINSPIGFDIKVKDETGSLIDSASYSITVLAVDSYGTTHQATVTKPTKGIAHVEIPAIDRDVTLTVTARFQGPGMNTPVDDVISFPVKTGVIILEHTIPADASTGKQVSLSFATYTANRQQLRLDANSEIKVTVEPPYGGVETLQLQSSMTSNRYTAYYTPKEDGGYHFKIEINKAGYEQVIYGEDPNPEIVMSSTKGGGGGSGITQYWWVLLVAIPIVGMVVLLRGGK